MTITLSHSSIQLWQKCQRAFYFEKFLLYAQRKDTGDTMFGRAAGAMLQKYAELKDKDRAILAGLLEWDMELVVKDKELKELFRILDNFIREFDFSKYHFVEKELCFEFELIDGFNYLGYVDLTLQEIATQKYVFIDFKTTKLSPWAFPYLFGHSWQLASYMLIHPNASRGEYVIFQLPTCTMYVEKAQKKDDVLQTLRSIARDIERAKEEHRFLQNPGSCYSMGKACPHFQNCSNWNKIPVNPLGKPSEHKPYTILVQE